MLLLFCFALFCFEMDRNANNVWFFYFVGTTSTTRFFSFSHCFPFQLLTYVCKVFPIENLFHVDTTNHSMVFTKTFYTYTSFMQTIIYSTSITITRYQTNCIKTMKVKLITDNIGWRTATKLTLRNEKIPNSKKELHKKQQK